MPCCVYYPNRVDSGPDDPPATLGSALLNLLNSPRQFDAIYITANCAGVRAAYQADMVRRYRFTDVWPLIQQRTRERHIKLYLHICPGFRPGYSDPLLEEFIASIRSTGGTVKIGPLPRPGEEIVAPAGTPPPLH